MADAKRGGHLGGGGGAGDDHGNPRKGVRPASSRLAEESRRGVKPWACWRCNQLNSWWASECGRCGQRMQKNAAEV
jgi:ribosomal protein L40E